MTLICDCGKEIDDWRGARGHVQFIGDDLHDDKMELPDDWKDLFEETADAGEDVEDDGNADLPDVCRKCEDRDRMDGSMVCEQCADDDDVEQVETDDADPNGRGLGGRLSAALTDDVRALWGGDR